MAMELILLANLCELAVGRGELAAEALAIWLRQRTRRVEP